MFRSFIAFVAFLLISAAAAFAVSDEIVESFPIAGNIPYGLAYDGSYFYITEYLDQTILVVDPSNGSIVNTLTLTPTPPPTAFLLGLTFDGTSLWVITIGAGKKLYQVNPANGAILSEPGLPPPFSGPGSNPVGIAWDGTYFYLSNNSPGNTYLGSVELTGGGQLVLVEDWISSAKWPDGVAYTQHEGNDYVFNVGNEDGWTFLYDTDGELYYGDQFKLNVPGDSWWGGTAFAGNDTDLWMLMGSTETLYHLNIDWSGSEFVNVEPASFGRVKSLYR